MYFHHHHIHVLMFETFNAFKIFNSSLSQILSADVATGLRDIHILQVLQIRSMESGPW